jgi:hypothetical protein
LFIFTTQLLSKSPCEPKNSFTDKNKREKEKSIEFICFSSKCIDGDSNSEGEKKRDSRGLQALAQAGEARILKLHEAP